MPNCALKCNFSQKIDRECALVPRGALSLDTGKKVIANTNYQGLSYETSTQLRAFMHLRRPENLQGIALLKRPGILKTDDFLDCIDNDLPKGECCLYCTGVVFVCVDEKHLVESKVDDDTFQHLFSLPIPNFYRTLL